jgi:hypothetical protein
MSDHIHGPGCGHPTRSPDSPDPCPDCERIGAPCAEHLLNHPVDGALLEQSIRATGKPGLKSDGWTIADHYNRNFAPRSSDSPDPQDLLDKMIVRRDVPDGEVRFVSEAECITVRSPDSPDPGHGLLHCHRCGKCICPLHEAIADDTWTEARRLCASCFDGPPRSPDSVRTPDFDVSSERIRHYMAIWDRLAQGDRDTLKEHYPDDAKQIGYYDGYATAARDVLSFLDRGRFAPDDAALHPASPPQEGEK